MVSVAEEIASAALTLKGTLLPSYASVLTPAAQLFLAELQHRFEPTRAQLLDARRKRQAAFDAGALPDFLPETRALRESEWRVAEIPAVLQDRRVEITGPTDRKMIINALNSGARVFMADFEDSTSPTFDNLIDGQINLRDAVAGSIEFHSPEGKQYRLHAQPALLMVRPRGWHLDEKHVQLAGRPLSASLFDLGLFAFHNAAALHATGRGPFFYLPKLESHREAALWDAVLGFIETRLELPAGSIKVTVLIETLPAAFEMDEILHALKSRIVGLNCGRWDYIFSTIKTYRCHRERVLPERGQVAMTVPFLKAYAERLIRTCHRRGALAMGGMAAQIPISGDPAANELALEKVRADKRREVGAGHDGTWVAHPALVPLAQSIFDAAMPTPNQLTVLREDANHGRDELLAVPSGSITRGGFLGNLDVAVRYLAAWLAGQGCVPIQHLMEDAATAEIARVQLWQWLHHGELKLDDGTPISFELFDRSVESIAQRLPKHGLPGQERIAQAAWMLAEMTHAKELAPFLTVPAYALLA